MERVPGAVMHPLAITTYHLELRFSRIRILLVALALHLRLGSLVLRCQQGFAAIATDSGVRVCGMEPGVGRGVHRTADGTIAVLTLPMMTIVRGVL